MARDRTGQVLKEAKQRLATAERTHAESAASVASQEQVIADLAQSGQPTVDAAKSLEKFQGFAEHAAHELERRRHDLEGLQATAERKLAAG
jgi:hypothetical protein